MQGASKEWGLASYKERCISERKLASHKARALGGATNEDNKWNNFKKQKKTQLLAICLL